MVCDVISLIYVSYYFIENGLPWTDYIDLCMLNDPTVNLYDLANFKKIRLEKADDFCLEYEECFRPFGTIFKYLYGIIKKQTLKNPLPVDYDHILAMIPNNITFHKT
jgi:hypothetical protein